MFWTHATLNLQYMSPIHMWDPHIINVMLDAFETVNTTSYCKYMHSINKEWL